MRVILQVNTPNVSDMDLLVRMFGGHFYKHLYTRLWILQKKEDLLRCAKEVLPFCTDDDKKRLRHLLATLPEQDE